ncbi:MAG: rRNA pseudouridine synthase [Armatimonadetes bacterium]|nr:rRNA pseudouridine synthase [Armatimonadota bacterium]
MERLQKILARAGVASRRDSEQLILKGRVSVNGQTVRDLGVKADPEADEIRVDGNPLPAPERQVYILLHKPAGYTSTRSDPHAEHTVLELVPDKGRLFPVGRLDVETRGLLILTNDGEFAYRLTHPSQGVPKTYRAAVHGMVPSATLRQLEQGIPLEEGTTAPARARRLRYSAKTERSVVEITLKEGRKRQVRRMMAAAGHPVITLERTAIGPLTLRGLSEGKWRFLTPDEVAVLKGEKPPAPAKRRPDPRRPKRRRA